MTRVCPSRADSQDALLLRGAVFYVSMSLWGVRRVESLELSLAVVLPSIREVGPAPCGLAVLACCPPQAVLSGHTLVVYEVALSLQRLVRTSSGQLRPPDWALLYSTLAAILHHLQQLKKVAGGGGGRAGGLDLTASCPQALVEPMASHRLLQCVHSVFSSVQEALEQAGAGQAGAGAGQAGDIGRPEPFFALVEAGADVLPVSPAALFSPHPPPSTPLPPPSTPLPPPCSLHPAPSTPLPPPLPAVLAAAAAGSQGSHHRLCGAGLAGEAGSTNGQVLHVCLLSTLFTPPPPPPPPPPTLISPSHPHTLTPSGVRSALAFV